MCNKDHLLESTNWKEKYGFSQESKHLKRLVIILIFNPWRRKAQKWTEETVDIRSRFPFRTDRRQESIWGDW